MNQNINNAASSVDLSFIMPVKNVEYFIDETVQSIRFQSFKNWELIVVDDGSVDRTPDILNALASGDPRIRVLRNPGRGQVQAINYGATFIRGKYVKIVDGDDLLPASFSDCLDRLTSEEATYHDAYLMMADKGAMSLFRVGARFQEMELADSLQHIMVSPPRWSWTISRRTADGVFPLPADLPSPHEDVYLGLKIKKCARVAYVPVPLYLYRQHAAQFYGGLFSFSPKVVTWRARAMLGVIDLVKNGDFFSADVAADLLAPAIGYYRLLAAEPLAVRDILGAKLNLRDKLRVLVIRKTPALAAMISRRRALRRIRIRKL